ncbi:MAG: BON domain-containing protein [Calothrix sp. MO_167.B12]|nr:BON domain-containing protein [Calothrix sp. MO_167.B12]
MKNVIPFLITGILVVGAVGCQDTTPQASSDKPADTTESAQTPVEPASPVTDSVTETAPKVTDGVEENQNANVPGSDSPGSAVPGTSAIDAESTSVIASKLKEALPTSDLKVTEKDGNIVISGTVSDAKQLKIVDQIISQEKSVKPITNQVTIEEAPKP